jgi:adenosylhomocysteine nucleosidase
LIEPRPLAILAALKEELAAIRLRLGDPCLVNSGGRSYLRGTIDGLPVALVRTGMGLEAAGTSAEWVFRALSPFATVSTGFAGGLRDDLRPGDLVLATEVFDPPPPDGQGPRAFRGDPELFDSAKKIVRTAVMEGTGQRRAARELRMVEGRVATVREALSSSMAKRAFGDAHAALAVDMESAAIARAAGAAGARVLYLRAIVDEAGLDLPLDVIAKIMTPEGRLRIGAAVGAVLRRPSALIALEGLRRRSGVGAENLGAAISALIPIIRPSKDAHAAGS